MTLPRVPRIFSSFRFRLFAALSLVIFTLMPLLGYIAYLQAKKGIEHQLEQFAASTAVQITGRIHEYLSHHSSNVRLLKRMLENNLINPGDSHQMIQAFHLFREGHPGFANILYGDINGHFVMVPPQMPEVHLLFDPRSRPWFQGAVSGKQVFWTPVYLFASTRKPGITASLPVNDAHGRLQGVCGIDIDLSTFSAFLANLQIGHGGKVSIIENSTGHVVAHPEFVGHRPDMNNIARFSTCLADLRQSGQHSGIINCRGSRWFAAYAEYPEHDWSVCISLPESEYLMEISKIRRTTLGLLVAGLCLASGISFLFARTLVKPMERLEQGIRKISRGDLNYRVAAGGPDLADSMASAVNEMAAALCKDRDTLKKTLSELAEKKRLSALGQLTAGIAHEIKNPLGIILGSAEIMADQSKPLAMRERAADFVVEEVERLNKILKNFLAFARPVSPEFQLIAPRIILEETLERYDELLREQDIAVERIFLEQSPCCLLDPDQILQVFINLIINAMAAMPDGGTLQCREKIMPGSAANPSEVEISIRDTGTGIPEEHLERIFDPFVSFRDEGSGLGLSIVRQIIDLHGGSIHVESAPGSGTRFSLLLPVHVKEEK